MIEPALPKIAISSCLLGEKVRYDGNEKRSDALISFFSTRATLLSLCPEVGAGMAVPRPPIAVVHAKGQRFLRLVDSGEDVTEAMLSFAKRTLPSLANISGYIFKARSPSCGLRDTPQFLSGNTTLPFSRGSGVWAQSVQSEYPQLPIATEDELSSEVEREAFLLAVRAFRKSQA